MQKLLHRHEVDDIDSEIYEVIKANFFATIIGEAFFDKCRNGAFEIFRNWQAISEILEVYFVGNNVFLWRNAIGQGSCWRSRRPDSAFSEGIIAHPCIRIGNMCWGSLEKVIARIFRTVNCEVVPDTFQISFEDRFPDTVVVHLHVDGLIGLCIVLAFVEI